MIFRISCKTENCNGRILLMTAQETDEFCMPCFKSDKPLFLFHEAQGRETLPSLIIKRAHERYTSRFYGFPYP
jgi:hypothetical protein